MYKKSMVVLLAGVMCLLGATSALAQKYNEAPMLKELVQAGKLPPLEERLPEEPLVIEVYEEIGQYGGTVRMLMPTVVDWGEPTEANFENLFAMDRNFTKIEPNIAKKWEFSEGNRVLTVYLRKGMRWSDGEPFNADDMVFSYEDIVWNDDIHPRGPVRSANLAWAVGSEYATIEKVDDYTIRFHFAGPNPNILLPLGGVNFGFWQSHFYPKHYLKQFHLKYNEKANELAKAAGVDNWIQLLKNKMEFTSGQQANVDLPVLTAWVPKKVTPNDVLWERNPYYFKVDPEGNQLPYIDYMTGTMALTPELSSLKAIAGEVDFGQRMFKLEDYPLYFEAAKKHNLRVWTPTSGYTSNPGFWFNLNLDDDPVKRDIFRDVRFRRALSLAINRKEVNQKVNYGTGRPAQMTYGPDVPGYEARFANAYASFDTGEANRLLDEMGLDKRDGQGFRLRPDGKVLTVSIVVVSGGEIAWVETSELVGLYWRDVGVKASVKQMDRGAAFELRNAAQHEVLVFINGGVVGGMAALATASARYMWFPDWFAPKWFGWDGKSGEAPSEDFQKLKSLQEQLWGSGNKEEQKDLLRQIGELQAENIWGIGTVSHSKKPGVAAANLRNMDESALTDTYDTSCLRYQLPEQWFFKK